MTLSEEQALADRNFDRWSVLRGTPGKLKDGVKRLAMAYSFDPNGSYFNLSREARVAYLKGDLSVGYEGLMPFLQRISVGAEGAATTTCPSCHGSRIGEEARNVTIGGLHISALAEKTLREQAYFWEGVSGYIIDAGPNLSGVLKRIQMQNQGNSVIVVEHDLGVIRAADWIIEIGPGSTLTLI